MRIETHWGLSYLVVLEVMTLLVASGVCIAQDTEGWSREGTGEIYFIVQSTGSDTVSYGLARDEVDATTAYGGGIGANGKYLSLNMEFLYGSTSDTWTIGAVSVERDASIWFWNFNLDYNILKGRLTPVVTGGIGFLGMSGETFDGYDYRETVFSYNVGAGGRWDITDHIALKVLYRSTWGKFDEADDSNQFQGILATIAYVFQ